MRLLGRGRNKNDYKIMSRKQLEGLISAPNVYQTTSRSRHKRTSQPVPKTIPIFNPAPAPKPIKFCTYDN